MTQIFDLQARQHKSRVLMSHLASRPGAFERSGVTVRNATTLVSSSDAAGMTRLFDPLPTASGFPVTDQTAMQVSTVYRCLAVIGGSVLQLPLHMYRVAMDGTRERIQPYTPLWWMLNESPQPRWTAASWKEWVVRCVHLRGDQHTEILRYSAPGRANEVAGLLPHHPDHVQVRVVDGRLRYDIFDPATNRRYGRDQDDMLHFSGFGFDGVRSLSAIQYAARGAIANSLAASDYMGRNVGEGAMPKIALQYPNKLSTDQARLLRESFVAAYTGPGAQKLPLIMTEGGTATPLHISPIDMQLLGSRQFEKEDICEALGVPPIMIGNSEKTTSWGTGVEQVTLGFVKYTLQPHLCRWEEELNRKLFRQAGRFVEFSLDALLRGDSKAQAEVFRFALGGPGSGDGYMSVNEVRSLKNLPPVDGGDEPFRAQRGKDTQTGTTP